MEKHTKLFSVVSYITWIGWIAALLLRDKDDAIVRRHVNQALLLNLAETAASVLIKAGGLLAVIGEIASFAVLVLFIIGVVRAFKCSAEPLPFIGDIQLIR